MSFRECNLYPTKDCLGLSSTSSKLHINSHIFHENNLCPCQVAGHRMMQFPQQTLDLDFLQKENVVVRCDFRCIKIPSLQIFSNQPRWQFPKPPQRWVQPFGPTGNIDNRKRLKTPWASLTVGQVLGADI